MRRATARMCCTSSFFVSPWRFDSMHRRPSWSMVALQQCHPGDTGPTHSEPKGRGMERNVVGFLLVTAFALGCSSKGAADDGSSLRGERARTSPSRDLTGAGSTFVNPLMSKWISQYGKDHP